MVSIRATIGGVLKGLVFEVVRVWGLGFGTDSVSQWTLLPFLCFYLVGSPPIPKRERSWDESWGPKPYSYEEPGFRV